MKENIFRKAFDEDGSKGAYYFVFTLLFCITALFCFSWCIFKGRALIWNSDGWTQHYRALIYYSDYLKDIFRHLFQEHKLVIPDWDFYIGEGSA